MKKYDVGIFGWWYNMNYGANLTYFSLNRTVKQLGYSVAMVWKGFDPKDLPDTTAIRFAKKYYDIGPAFSKQEMYKHNDYYSTFLLGSDQLWSPRQEKITGEDFFLSFAASGKGKVAYAQSVGRDEKLPEDFTERYKKYVERFDGVSVREDYAADLVKKGFGVDAPHVCDPIFLSDKSIWDELIENAEIDLPDTGYVLNLILDPDLEKMQFCEKVRKKRRISEYINFTAMTPRVEWQKDFGKTPVGNEDGAVERLVRAYSKASFIITDSFHGTCLALIFNKPFISIANYKRGVERFESLLRWTGLENRLVYDINTDDIPKGSVNYSKVNDIIEKGRKDGLRWLRDRLKGTRSAPRILKPEMCVGCGACVSCCPAGALNIGTDEYGYYRAFLDREKCVDCGKCAVVCPAIQLPERNNLKDPELYVFQAKNKKLLYDSSSGGVFSLIAGRFIKDKGYVAGVAWDDDHSCRHVIINKQKDIKELNKSKYMQSYMGDVIRQIKKKTDSGKKVLFSGCPCQVAAVKKFFADKSDNLYTIDLLCGGAPSSWFFKKYLRDEYGDTVNEYSFRNKDKGWNCRTVSVKKGDDDPIVVGPKDGDKYQSLYHDHIMTSVHCENCQYQSLPRFGDVTIGDFWKIEKHMPELDTSEGISAVLCNSEKGRELISNITEDQYEIMQPAPLEWLGGNGYAYKGKNHASPSRDAFYDLILKHSFSETFRLLKTSEPEKKEISDDLQGEHPFLYVFDHSPKRFVCESKMWSQWEEISPEKGCILLHAVSDKTSRGHFAVLPLSEGFIKDREYGIKIICRIETSSPVFNFHITDKSNPKIHQVIIRHKNVKKQDKWVEINASFICNRDGYDSFSVGAAHLTGERRNIIFKYIGIFEKQS